jgi:hypothetical protein
MTTGIVVAGLALALAPVANAGAPDENGRGHAGPAPHAAAQSEAHGAPVGKSSHGPSKPKTSHGKPSSSTPTNTSTTGGTTTGSTPPTSPIAQKIESHPQLASRLKAMLPAGMTLDQAALGFRNQGQFIAALHVSQNLGIPFPSLKTDMVDKHMSLGQSIQALKPTANAPTAAKTGEDEAEHDLRTADAPRTTTKTTTKTSKPSTEQHDDNNQR